jgi:hypothetical protein
MRWIRRLALVLVAGLSVVAATTVPAAAKTAPRASCGLLRATEVAQALEQPSAGPTTGAAPLVCDWNLEPTDTRPAGAVSVYLRRGDDAREAFSLAKSFHGQDTKVVRVHGLGRPAFYVPGVGAVYVLAAPETLLAIQGVYPTGSTVDAAGLQAALVALAGKAERRL